VILADTSVWVDHLRASDKALVALLDAGMVLAHPFVIGELALGNLRQREIVLGRWRTYPMPVSRQTRRSFISSSVMRCSGAGSDISTLICSPRCN
jgi:predicted nucleic acid-binding protein